MRHLFFLSVLMGLLSCAKPHLQMTSDMVRAPLLAQNHAVMDDGYNLPLTVWRPKQTPQAVVLALHGFNDYRNAYSGIGPRLAAGHILTYAYDQRGFGATAQRGIWPGTETLVADAKRMVQMVCERHPQLPLFLIGESMGGAVVINLLQDADLPCVKGAILLAPAIWGWQTMPIWQRGLLRLAAHVAPRYIVSGQGLRITASDNTAMLEALRRDPLILKNARVDTLYGLTNLMESAYRAGAKLHAPSLFLYGENDEIIPAHSFCQLLRILPPMQTSRWRLALYPNGYHMLTRDLQAEVVITDMISWLHNQHSALPSGFEIERSGSSRLRLLCNKKTKKYLFDY